MSRPLLSLASVTKDFGNKRVLDEVGFNVAEGEFAVVLGPNGAGKTTTVRIIGGAVKPTMGSLSLFGNPINYSSSADFQAARLKIGIQNDGSLYERLTAKENLILWGELFGIERVKCLKKIDELFSVLELESGVDEPLTKFSKGMKQKVLLARALLHDPRLLILDEPTSGLDPLIAEKFLTYLNGLRRKTGMSVLMCTHRLEMVEEVADRLIVLRNGKLLAQGDVEELLQSPTSGIHLRVEVAGYGKKKLDETKLGELHGHVACRISHKRLITLRIAIDSERFIPDVVRLVSEQLDVYKIMPEHASIRHYYSQIMGE